MTDTRTEIAIGAVLSEVADEMAWQNEKWGEQNHPDGTGGVAASMTASLLRSVCDAAHAAGGDTWTKILGEEIAEALAETDPRELRGELIQVAAVAGQWALALDRRLAGEVAS